MRSVFCHCTVTQSGTQLYLFLIFLGNGMLGYYVSNPYAEVNKNDKWNQKSRKVNPEEFDLVSAGDRKADSFSILVVVDDDLVKTEQRGQGGIEAISEDPRIEFLGSCDAMCQ